MPALAKRHPCGTSARTGLRILTPVLLATCCASATAFGVGTPQLLSGYAEPLRVRVPVILDPAEERAIDTLRAELVPAADYTRYGVAEQSLDTGAIYTMSRSSGSGAWIEIGSAQPMREPATILLLRVRLGGTTIVREVPLLFEPGTPHAATVMTPAVDEVAVPAAPAAPVSVAARRPRAHTPQRASPAQRPAPSPAAPAYSSTSAGLHLEERFDSLAGWQLSHR